MQFPRGTPAAPPPSSRHDVEMRRSIYGCLRMSTSDPTGSGVVGARVAGCKTVSRYRRIYQSRLFYQMTQCTHHHGLENARTDGARRLRALSTSLGHPPKQPASVGPPLIPTPRPWRAQSEALALSSRSRPACSRRPVAPIEAQFDGVGLGAGRQHPYRAAVDLSAALTPHRAATQW